MAETLIENAVCESCGVDVRDDSLFCYNCGSAVAPVPAVPVEEVSVEKSSIGPGSRPPLRSAASLRKHRRAYNRQPVEISWEAPESSPKWFIIATIVLSIGAFVLFLIALYLR